MLGRHVREHERDRLLVRQRRAKRLALFAVRQGLLVGGARDSERLRRNADAPAVQRRHRHLEAVAFSADPVLVGHLAVVEEHRARMRGVDAELLVVLAARETGGVGRHDEGCRAARAEVALGHREHDDQAGVRAVGDEVLRAVEHPVVARALCKRRHRARIRAAHRLGQTEATQHLARRHRLEELHLLSLRAVLVDRIACKRVVHAHDDADRGARAADLLHRQRVPDAIETGAAVAFVDGDAHQAQLAHLSHDVGRPGAVLIEFLGPRLDLTQRKVACGLLQHRLFLGELEVHEEATMPVRARARKSVKRAPRPTPANRRASVARSARGSADPLDYKSGPSERRARPAY